MLASPTKERAKETIEKMKKEGLLEMRIPGTPLTVIKGKSGDHDLPIERMGDYLVIQRGL
jgi:hypothetical protein